MTPATLAPASPAGPHAPPDAAGDTPEAAATLATGGPACSGAATGAAPEAQTTTVAISPAGSGDPEGPAPEPEGWIAPVGPEGAGALVGPAPALEVLLAPSVAVGSGDGPSPAPDHDALLGVLTQLSRKHLLSFRIEVGRAVAAALYNDDPSAFHDTAWNKQGSLRQFAADRRQALADLGLSEPTLRQCVRAYFVARELPPGTIERLVISHLNLLSQLDDGASRRLLAQATVDNGWSGLDLRAAIQAVQAGQWPDGDPSTPGLQPSAPEPAPGAELRTLQPGRVVTRFERASDELDGLIGAWEKVPAEKRTAAQVARVKAAVSGWKERIARLEAELG